jgi:hypothetical protein
MSNYNFQPLSASSYLISTFRINQNTSIDIDKLLISNEGVGKDKEYYNLILSETATATNVVVGFYYSRNPSIPIIVEGGAQQAVSNFKIENGINYFVGVIAGKGKTIKFYRSSTSKLFFIDF